MIDLRPLIQPSFWFSLDPGYLSSPFVEMFFIIFSVCILAGAIVRIVARSKSKDRLVRESTMKVGSMLISMGLLGFIWYFFTFEGINFFGSRFWFLVWVIGLIVWSISLYRFVKREVPRMREEEKHRASVNQYLPRRSR